MDKFSRNLGPKENYKRSTLTISELFSKNYNPIVLEAALVYAAQGWPVFPIWAWSKSQNLNGQFKKPVARLAPNGFKNSTCDIKLINNWFSHRSDLGIGIATGRKSSLVVIDYDCKNLSAGESITSVLASLETHVGELPPTMTTRTPSGGIHHYYKSSEAFTCRVGVLPHIDVRGCGGYIIAPPTLGPNSIKYEFDSAIGPPIADLPKRLSEFLKGPVHTFYHATRTKTMSRLLADTVRIGDGRNQALARLSGFLFRNMNPVDALQILGAWNKTHCKPPLTEDDFFATVNSIAGLILKPKGQNHGK